MAEEIVADDNASAVDDGRAEISSIPDSLMSSPDLDQLAVSTVEQPEPVAEVEEDDKGTSAADEGAKADDKAARYDQDPAWQRIMTERNEAREKAIRLEAQMELLTKGTVQPAGNKGVVDEVLPYVDVTKKSAEEIREWMEDDPLGYQANLFAQFHHESKQLLEKEFAERKAAKNIDNTYSSYSKNNPDFQGMWDSGELRKFMDENPGHNAISAHLLLTADKRVAEAEAKAAKAAEAKVLANLKAKVSAAVVSEGPAHRGGTTPGVPKELTNTKQHGGLNSVLSQRLAAMRNKLSR